VEIEIRLRLGGPLSKIGSYWTAARTSGFSQLRSGCSGVKSERKYSSVFSSYVQALLASPRICDQLFGGNGFPAASRRGFFHMYHERLGLVREDRDSRNHACCVQKVRHFTIILITRWYLIRRVVDHEVHHQFHASFPEFGNKVVDIFDGAVDGIDSFVVGYIVSHVFLRTFVYYILSALDNCAR
jgi:hypothetical protein